MNKPLIEKLKLFLSQKELATFIEQSTANEKLQELIKVLTKVVEDNQKNSFEGIEMVKGEKGEDGEPGTPGHTPIVGVDFFTDEEKEAFKTELINLVLPEKGVDYFTQEDIDFILEAATPVKGKDYFTKDEIKEFKELVTPKKNLDYFDGEKGEQGEKGEGVNLENVTGEFIAEQLNKKTGVIEMKVISGLESALKKQVGIQFGKKKGGGTTITVSATAPHNPYINQLWYDIS